MALTGLAGPDQLHPGPPTLPKSQDPISTPSEPSAPTPGMLQQGQSPAPHSPALPDLGPSPAHGGAQRPGLGLPQCPGLLTPDQGGGTGTA